MFDNIDTTGMEKAKDSLGGFQLKDSDVYDAVVKYAYGGSSKGGAKFIQFEFDIGGSVYREQVYYTSGTDKGGKPYTEKDGVRRPLPGFTLCDNISLMITGKGILEQGPSVEKKTIRAYDFDKKEEVQKAVDMVMSLVGGKVKLGILKELVDKGTKQSDGSYKNLGETREQNSIDTVFHPEQLFTVAEKMAGAEKPEFIDAWTKKNKGQVVNKVKVKAAAGAGTSGRPESNSGAGSSEGRPNLFG